MRASPLAVAFLLLIALACRPAAGAEPPRVALVIGNAEYREGPLRNPVNDARAMARSLTGQGFEVILRLNAGKTEMEAAIAAFGERLEEGATGLFYYAGHGMQVDGRNFLIPVDAEIKSRQRVRLAAVEVDVVIDQMAAARTRVNLVILDACRNNPFERSFRSAGGGLAQMNAPEGTLIAYATAPGRVAADGEGENGLYTEELLRAMNEPGRKVEDVFKAVRAGVTKRSAGAQTPWESSSLIGDFYFRPARPAGTAAPSALSARQALDLALWDAVKESGRAEEFKAYLDQFPDGTFAGLARARMAAVTGPGGKAPAGAAAKPGPQAAPAALPAVLPGLDKTGRAAWDRFLAGREHRAFATALAPLTATGLATGAADAAKATWSAMQACTQAARAVCRLQAVNGNREAAAYDAFERESEAARAGLRQGMVAGSFRDEDRDFGIPPAAELRAESLHADTPLILPGARLIRTAELVDLLAGGAKPLLIDTLDGNRHGTLPGAFWFRGAGNRGKQPERAADLLDAVTQRLVSGKRAPVVVFCLSSQCWLSYNAGLRLVAAGYTGVLWYRGGVEAWRAAGLPTVRAVPHAQF